MRSPNVARFVVAAAVAIVLVAASSHAVAEMRRTGAPLDGERSSQAPTHGLTTAPSAAAPARSPRSLQRGSKLVDRLGLASSVRSLPTDSTQQEVARGIAAPRRESGYRRKELASNVAGSQSAQTAPPKQQRTRTITNRKPGDN